MKNVGDRLERRLEDAGVDFYTTDIREKEDIYYSIELAVWNRHFSIHEIILNLRVLWN